MFTFECINYGFWCASLLFSILIYIFLIWNEVCLTKKLTCISNDVFIFRRMRGRGRGCGWKNRGFQGRHLRRPHLSDCSVTEKPKPLTHPCRDGDPLGALATSDHGELIDQSSIKPVHNHLHRGQDQKAFTGYPRVILWLKYTDTPIWW